MAPMMLTRVLDAVVAMGFFNPAVAYLGCHRRVYRIDEQNGFVRWGIGKQRRILFDKGFLLE